MKTTDIARSVELYELKPGHMIPVALLAELLPNVEAALFFAKVYDFGYRKTSITEEPGKERFGHGRRVAIGFIERARGDVQGQLVQ